MVPSLQLMSLLPLEILRVQPSAVAWSFKILYCWDEKQKNEIVPSPHLMSLLPLKVASATQRCRSLLSSDPRTFVHLSFKIIQLLECPIYPRRLRHKKYGPLLPSVYFFEKCLTVWKTKQGCSIFLYLFVLFWICCIFMVFFQICFGFLSENCWDFLTFCFC